MLRSSFFAVGVTAVLAIVISFVSAGTGKSPSATRWDPPKSFTLVYNVNNAGYIDVCGCKHKEVRQGSLTRRASFLKQLRSTGRELLLVDGGSALFPVHDPVKDAQRDQAIHKAALIVEAYNRMGYRAMAVGVSDLAAGLDTLKEFEKRAKFAMLSANLVDKETGKPHFKPYEIVEVAGVRVGIFGLTLETLSKPYRQKTCPNSELRDPLTVAKEVVSELEGKVDLIVALSHLRQETNHELARDLVDLQIIVDPYIEHQSHRTWIKEPEWLNFQGETVFLRSDGQGARLGTLDIEMKAPTRKLSDLVERDELEALVADGEATAEQKAQLEGMQDKNTFEFTRVSIEPHHRQDPEIDRLVAEWKNNIDPSKVARLEGELPTRADFLTAGKCQSCHEPQFKFWQKTKHARALDSLLATDDQHRFDCVGCHSLGYGEAFLDTSKIGAYAHVQCESCHGTNPQHPTAPGKHAFGKVAKITCLSCHNETQTLKDFNYHQAKRQVACPKG